MSDCPACKKPRDAGTMHNCAAPVRANLITPNDLKKGDRVMQKSGWLCTIKDNKKGNIRMIEADGPFREMGSCYVWEFSYRVNPDGSNETIELTDAMKKAKQTINAMGF